MAEGFKIADAWVDVSFDTSRGEQQLERAFADRRQSVRVDVDTAGADASLERFAAHMARIDGKTLRAKVDLDFNQAQAAASLAALGRQTAELERLDGKRIKFVFDLDARGAIAEMAALGRQAQNLEKLDGRHIRVRVDVDGIAEAMAQLASLTAVLDRMDSRQIRLRADADLASATARLMALEQRVNSVDGRTAHVGVDADVGVALAKIGLVGAALGGISALAVAGIGGIAGVGAVLAGGFGAAFASLSGVGGAVKALGEQTTTSGSSAAQAASQHMQMANAIDRVRSAQNALANARANAASAAVRAQEQIASAERRLQTAEESEQRAQEDLTQARADATAQLADLQRRTEEMALSQEAAQIALLRARERQAEVDRDANATALDRREAAIRVAEAEQRLKEISEDATKLAREKASADKAGIEGSDQVVSATRRVRDAHDGVTDAQRGVADAVRAAAEQQRQSAYSIAQAQQQVVQAQRAVQQASQQAGTAGAAGIDKVGQAMAGLSPVAQDFARYLRGLVDGPIAALRRAGQENMLPGLQRGLMAAEPVLTQMLPVFGQFSKTLGDAFAGIAPILARLAVPFLRFADAALRGLAPLGPVLDQFATAFSAMVDRVTASGVLQQAMGAIVQIIGALIGYLPDLIEDGLQLMVVLGPPLAQVVGALLPVVVALAEAFGPILAQALTALVPVLQWLTQVIAAHPRIVGAVTVGVLALGAAFSALAPVVGMVTGVLGAVSLPMVAVVAGIGLLAAGLIAAYRSSEPFRAAVASLGQHLMAAGQTILSMVMPPLQQLWSTIQTQVVPALADFGTAVSPIISWLVDKLAPVVGTVFASIVKVIDGAMKILSGLLKVATGLITGDWSNAWSGVKQIFSGIWEQIKAVFAAAWAVIKAAFSIELAALQAVWGRMWANIKAAGSAAWAWIKSNTFDRIAAGLRSLGGWFTALWTNYVRPAWDNIRSGLAAGWNWLRVNVFDRFTSAARSLGGVFGAAASAIGTAWARVREAAAAPVRFVVNTVINRGIIDTYNNIAGRLGAPKLPRVPGFAGGGPVRGPGTGTSDSIPALLPGGGPAALSNNEWVIRARAAEKIGDDKMALINNADRLGLQASGDPGTLVLRPRGYADGGKVASTMSWLRGLTTHPYVWGGVGPWGFDCTGLGGAVQAMVKGQQPFRRYFTTGTFLASPSTWGFRPGTGMLTLGVNDHHMVGNLAGLGFEAPHTGANIRVGSAAQTPSAVGRSFYLADLGAGTDDGGLIGWVKNMAKTAVDKLTGSWWGQLARMGVMGKLAIGLGRKVMGSVFDQGGWWQPGTVGVNTGQTPEPVFTGQQWETLRSLVPAQRSDSAATQATGGVTISGDVIVRLPDSAAQSLTAALRSMSRADVETFTRLFRDELLRLEASER